MFTVTINLREYFHTKSVKRNENCKEKTKLNILERVNICSSVCVYSLSSYPSQNKSSQSQQICSQCLKIQFLLCRFLLLLFNQYQIKTTVNKSFEFENPHTRCTSTLVHCIFIHTCNIDVDKCTPDTFFGVFWLPCFPFVYIFHFGADSLKNGFERRGSGRRIELTRDLL